MTTNDKERRTEERLRRLGTRTPRCSRTGCIEINPIALVGTDPGIWCYEHQAEEAGRLWVEAHHLAGRNNDPVTAAVPGNDHRVLSDLQRDWPPDTLRNAEASPLIRAAAAIRGWLDVLWVILTRAVAWIPEALEWLDRRLLDHIGSEWWVTLEWNPA